jgi:hypothetical protein
LSGKLRKLLLLLMGRDMTVFMTVYIKKARRLVLLLPHKEIDVIGVSERSLW